MVALKILMDREDNPSEYNLEDEWDRQNHYPENEHDHYLHDHEHFGEDGFFCNPVGMSCKEDWVLFCKVKRMIYHICKESESVRVRVHVHLCVCVNKIKILTENQCHISLKPVLLISHSTRIRPCCGKEHTPNGLFTHTEAPARHMRAG